MKLSPDAEVAVKGWWDASIDWLGEWWVVPFFFIIALVIVKNINEKNDRYDQQVRDLASEGKATSGEALIADRLNVLIIHAEEIKIFVIAILTVLIYVNFLQ